MSYPLSQNPVPVWAAPNRAPIQIDPDRLPQYLLSAEPEKFRTNENPMFLKQSGRWNSFISPENEKKSSGKAEQAGTDPTLLDFYDLNTKWKYRMDADYEPNGVISKVERFQESFVKELAMNPFFPIALRGSASMFSVICLGLACAVFVQSRQVRRVPGIVLEFPTGHSPSASTIFTIIVSVISFVYLLFSLWDETFGQPLGLRKVTHKLKFVAMDLVIMCLISASLAASFEAMISKEYICPAFQNRLVCKLHKAVVSFVFVTLATLFLTFLTSTFRMVGRASH